MEALCLDFIVKVLTFCVFGPFFSVVYKILFHLTTS